MLKSCVAAVHTLKLSTTQLLFLVQKYTMHWTVNKTNFVQLVQETAANDPNFVQLLRMPTCYKQQMVLLLLLCLSTSFFVFMNVCGVVTRGGTGRQGENALKLNFSFNTNLYTYIMLPLPWTPSGDPGYPGENPTLEIIFTRWLLLLHNAVTYLFHLPTFTDAKAIGRPGQFTKFFPSKVSRTHKHLDVFLSSLWQSR